MGKRMAKKTPVRKRAPRTAKKPSAPAARLWSGTISFGLVTIPVRLAPALLRDPVAFHLLHDKDHARLNRVMFCPEHERAIHGEHIVRGFETAPEKYVIVRERELESLEPKRSTTIEIQDFVDLDAIDPLYYDRPYYVLPAGADKPYVLLTQALAQSGKAGIAQFVMHAREYLVALRSIDGVLCLLTLRYRKDIVDPAELAVDTRGDGAALEAVSKSMRALTGPFHPEKYHDAYRERVQELIKSKQRKGAVVEAPEAESEEAAEPAEPEELISTLRKSLATARRKRGK